MVKLTVAGSVLTINDMVIRGVEVPDDVHDGRTVLEQLASAGIVPTDEVIAKYPEMFAHIPGKTLHLVSGTSGVLTKGPGPRVINITFGGSNGNT